MRIIGFSKQTKCPKCSWYALFLRVLVYAASAVTLLSLLFLLLYILIKGLPQLSSKLFEWKYSSENVSLMPALVNTLLMTLLSLTIAVPAGVGAAIYMAEYAPRGSRFIKLVRITAETLSGIPSIVYGLFGSLFFVKYLRLGISLISGALTLSIMILPLVIRTAEEALHSVPDSFREGSFGLGAGRMRTVFQVLLPHAMPGILSGIILSTGRIVGETAALIFTAGTVAEVADSLFDSARTLSVHMYTISGEGLYMGQTYASAVILIVVVIVINTASELISERLGKGEKHG